MAALHETTADDIRIDARLKPEYEKILSPEALAFLAALHKQFNPTRLQLLERRKARQVKRPFRLRSRTDALRSPGR
jgi:malate synthase